MNGTSVCHDRRDDRDPRARVTAAAEDVTRAIERRAPRSAGLAGIVFSLLFVAAVALAGTRPPDGLTEAGLLEWFEQSAKVPWTIAALYLLPFAGIAFLWFMGVVRDRIGVQEDRFLSTVFLGSGLLFVAMLWASAAAIATVLVGGRYDAAPPVSAASLESARELAYASLFVLASRAAGVVMIVTSTIAFRTATFPRWLIIAGYVIALVMLLSVSALQWILLLFPAWVFVLSLFILNSELRSAQDGSSVSPNGTL
jgi:hypothetical protein